MTKKIDIKDFGRRVERLCDFIIAKIMSESLKAEDRPNLKVLQDLKEEAADIQFHNVLEFTETLDGLYDYMKEGGTVDESSPRSDDKTIRS